ncbi:putative 1,2-Dihydroxy-3-keto-5-methylthiopentene dioxygenase [Trypanosoma theileri]|uniref:Acireductone dioxygenase n=1 Tax=Trypanosoma theileri TaxID=67003 RepID=A0A1X0NWZ5_9TRYP|nr:putative 1,2-Dihydroxy-3-keto-5-methylthiopentene dioxygenase [Trypanosoma theileri]ORC88993.1 putative 1,2-Dihydroxy-3-keto-5-methylthiopentene dioxygenase [Trypanosoma theileri]
MPECWIMPAEIQDPKAPNKCTPNVPVDIAALTALGVSYRHLDLSDLLKNAEKLETPILALKKELGYVGHDIVCISPDKHLGGPTAFEDQLKIFFTEHIHEDDEVRLILYGAGYFDVRNTDNAWVRIYVKPGDFLLLPAGIAHRFTVDHTQHTEALRLFKENPKWLAITPPFDNNPARQEYLQFLNKHK